MLSIMPRKYPIAILKIHIPINAVNMVYLVSPAPLSPAESTNEIGHANNATLFHLSSIAERSITSGTFV